VESQRRVDPPGRGAGRIYVIRTSEAAADLGAADCVRTYKSLAVLERAFRCLKGLDLLVRRSGIESIRVCVGTSCVHVGLLRRMAHA